jgi:hypothetical protein
VAAVQPEHLLLQFGRIGQVAVVGEGQSERRIDVEGLCLLAVGRGAGSGIADMCNAGGTRQSPHVAGPEDVPHEAVAFLHRERAAGAGRDAGCILAAVLEQQETVVQHLVDRSPCNDAENSTHVRSPVQSIKAMVFNAD